jgi:hypothetical protein
LSRFGAGISAAILATDFAIVATNRAADELVLGARRSSTAEPREHGSGKCAADHTDSVPARNGRSESAGNIIE